MNKQVAELTAISCECFRLLLMVSNDCLTPISCSLRLGKHSDEICWKHRSVFDEDAFGKGSISDQHLGPCSNVESWLPREEGEEEEKENEAKDGDGEEEEGEE